MTEHGIPAPEADVPHTELGTREGRKGKYPQAREFDRGGRPIRDIDFTDHGTPNKYQTLINIEEKITQVEGLAQGKMQNHYQIGNINEN